ncbi:Uncharacterised protein [Raoultella terrigena]|uniref:Uncharacterized protein n=1 Tax=Raoultella terrigena TaxID=577 RepID=A0A4U9DH47_RAOTE|nr:Uncharacterised protein [Raoultella terrigena]
MCDVEKLSISYIELKEITEKRLLNRLKNERTGRTAL